MLRGMKSFLHTESSRNLLEIQPDALQRHKPLSAHNCLRARHVSFRVSRPVARSAGIFRPLVALNGSSLFGEVGTVAMSPWRIDILFVDVDRALFPIWRIETLMLSDKTLR